MLPKANTRATLALGRLGKTQTEISKICGVSQALISQYMRGRCLPGHDNRMVIMSCFGIPTEDWDVAASHEEVPTILAENAIRSSRNELRNVTGSVPPKDAHLYPIEPESGSHFSSHSVDSGGVIEKARVLDAMAHQLIEGLRKDSSYSPLEKAKFMATISTTLTTIGKLLGQFDTGKHFLKLPIWIRVTSELRDALKGHPEAAADVAARFQKLEQEYS